MDRYTRWLDELDVGRVAMVYAETHIPCFRRVACGDTEMTFIEFRNTFAAWCGYKPVRCNTPHTYGVTSFGLDHSDVCTDVMLSSAVLHAIVRHEARTTAPEAAIVARTIRESLDQIKSGHGYYSIPYRFFNPFDVNYVLVAALYEQSRGLRLVATSWLSSLECAGVNLKLVYARKIARVIRDSDMFARAMRRGYAPGGKIADALKESFAREFQ
jgi:hypothetical protein